MQYHVPTHFKSALAEKKTFKNRFLHKHAYGKKTQKEKSTWYFSNYNRSYNTKISKNRNISMADTIREQRSPSVTLDTQW